MKKKYIAPTIDQQKVDMTQIIAASPSSDYTPQIEDDSPGGDALVKDNDYGMGSLW